MSRRASPSESKQQPLPLLYIFSEFAAALFLEFLPYLEELWRRWRANRRLVPQRPHGSS
jgi:hypothetical protein